MVEVLLIIFAAYPELEMDGAVDGSELAPLFTYVLGVSAWPGGWRRSIADR